MIQKLTSELLDKIIHEIRRDDNISKIQIGVVDPLIHYTFDRMYPYIIVSAIIFLLTFLLAITILLLILRSNIK
jgi:hypothetical protein